MRIAQRVLLLISGALMLAACGQTLVPASSGQPAATSIPVQQQQQAPTSTPRPTVQAIAPPTYLVQRGDVQEILQFTGRWEPRDQLLLSFSTSGTVRRVNIRVGDTIQVGQLLADFQIDQLEQSLQSAQLDLQTAQINLNTGSNSITTTVSDAEISLANARLSLERTKMGNPWQQVASARIQVENAQISLANAQRDYDDVVSRPTSTATSINAAYDKLISAQNSLRSAQISYDSSAASYASYQVQIKQAENSVIQAELKLQQAKSGGSVDPQRQQSVLSAQLRVDQVKQQIAQASLYAPIDAEVLAISIKAGDAVKAFDAVITVGRFLPKEAVSSLPFADAQKLSPGLVGTCQVLNKPETAVQCIVRRIPRNSRDADQTTRVAASLEDLKLATGQLIDVQMPIRVAKNVLWLPPQAVRTFQNRNFVVIQGPDGPRRADVTIGLSTSDRVEIQIGVQEGDIVIGP